MNSLRKTVSFLLVLVFAGFALPSGAAQQKLFNAVIPTFITSSPVTIVINNTSPGNSTINSISIAVNSNNVSINCANNTLGTGTLTGGACIITGFNGIASNTSRTFQLPVTFLSGACANATWTVNANTGNAYPQGTPFTPVDQVYISSCDGTLACYTGGDIFDPAWSFTSGSGDATVHGTRYPNKDGGSCVTVAYDFTNFIVTNTNTIHQVWDTNSQPNAVFTYAIPWKPVWANTNPQYPLGLPKPTQVAWNTSGPPQYVDARFCLTQNLPAAVGTLGAAINTTASPIAITVNNSSITTFTQKFPIVIDQERMTVTAISGNQWTVTRGLSGGGGGTMVTTHLQTYPDLTAKKVMSTPLPLDGNGVTGNLMRMCILAQAVNTVTPDQCVLALPPTDPPPACLQMDQTLLDAGDGWSTSE